MVVSVERGNVGGMEGASGDGRVIIGERIRAFDVESGGAVGERGSVGKCGG